MLAIIFIWQTKYQNVDFRKSFRKLFQIIKSRDFSTQQRFKFGITLKYLILRYLHSIPQSEIRFIRPHEYLQSSSCAYIYIYKRFWKICSLDISFDSISLMRPSKLYTNSTRALRREKYSPRRFCIISTRVRTFIRYYHLALIRVIIDYVAKKISDRMVSWSFSSSLWFFFFFHRWNGRNLKLIKTHHMKETREAKYSESKYLLKN